MDFSFDSIDFSSYSDIAVSNTNINTNTNTNTNTNNNSSSNKNSNKISEKYDNTTTEIYRIKRLYKIDPILDNEVPKELIFKFMFKWNPYNGSRGEIDDVGPLCFNAINLYDYYYINRYNGLWTPPQDGFQGMYGDMVGSGKNVNIKSRGTYPEKYLFRLPIIDCYLPPTHNLSIVTMGPELFEDEINEIDSIIKKSHPKKFHPKFASLTMLKYYYDRALDMSPDPNSSDIKEFKSKYPNLSLKEINQKYNRYYVDKLVNLKY
jgi:hypothetical protein